MSESIAYLNGQIIPASQASISVSDPGFMLGVTVAEQLRTFGGKLFRLDEHLDRLERSLQIVGVDSQHSRRDLRRITEEIAAHNFGLLRPGDDLGVTLFVTPGNSPEEPTVCIHPRPLLFRQWAEKYRSGESLATTDVEQVSIRCWPAELKCRSRMHYYLADRQAAARFPGSRALMLDENGFATEATTANVLVYRTNEGLLTPPGTKILPGISLGVLEQLAGEMGITLTRRDLRPEDVAAADEVLLCSTSPCVLPVTQFNGRPIADGKPGSVFGSLLNGWSKLVNLDIAAQAETMSAS